MEESLLEDYYGNCFPGQQICDWLSYGNSPDSADVYMDRDFLAKREFSFTLAGDIYCRHKAFSNWTDMKEELRKVKPEKIDAGAVWTYSPKSKGVRGGKYEPVEREFVFDIDMNDYDPVRTCCTGPVLCPRCWAYMVIACKSLNFILTESLGYTHLLWVFSGRRGIHCWVCDPAARRLNDKRRNELVNYINSGPKACFPFFNVYTEFLKPGFGPICVDSQNLFASDEQIIKAQDLVGDTAHQHVNLHTMTSSRARWEALRSALPQLLNQEEGETADSKCMKVSFAFMFPRLDVNVSTRMDHLLKLPFSIHPKTARVCVPFDPLHIDEFNPNAVPTVVEIVTNPSLLAPYVEWLSAFAQRVSAVTREERATRVQIQKTMTEKELTY